MPADPNPKLTAAREALAVLALGTCQDKLRVQGFGPDGDFVTMRAPCVRCAGHDGEHDDITPDFAVDDIAAHLATAFAEIDRLTAENAQLADEIAHPITCPACGSCGETGCCATPMCRYLNAHQGDYNEMVAEVERLTAELATAHATGRRVGLEEAARVCDKRADRFSGSADARFGAEWCAEDIRALIPKEPTDAR